MDTKELERVFFQFVANDLKTSFAPAAWKVHYLMLVNALFYNKMVLFLSFALKFITLELLKGIMQFETLEIQK